MGNRVTTATPHASWEGRILADKYQLDRPLGAGGMGTVWSATHLVLGTTLAIKLIRREFAAQPEARNRFEIEARAAAQINSVHAVTMYDHGVTDDGIPYLVMEYLEGESLAEYIVRSGALPMEEACEIILQASRALERAHSRGVVHRDLKPDNFYLATNAEVAGLPTPYVVKLVDFGIAKLLDSAPGSLGGGAFAGPTKTGMVIGTPSFMSPEQLASGGGIPDHLVDVWALGCTAFTAVCGRIPFEGEVLGDIVLKVCALPLPVPSRVAPEVPAWFDAWFAKACARDRTARYQSAAEAALALTQLTASAFNAGAAPIAAPSLRNYAQSLSNVEPLNDDDEAPDFTARGLPPRAAWLIGIVLGLSLAVAIIGYLAYQAKVQREAEPVPVPAAVPTATSR
jgi:eukaryotic-like serine/threonine-protein kinase